MKHCFQWIFKVIITTFYFGWKTSKIFLQFSIETHKKLYFYPVFKNCVGVHLQNRQQTVCRLHPKRYFLCNHALSDVQCKETVQNDTRVYFNSFCQFSHVFTGFQSLWAAYATEKFSHFHFFKSTSIEKQIQHSLLRRFLNIASNLFISLLNLICL